MYVKTKREHSILSELLVWDMFISRPVWSESHQFPPKSHLSKAFLLPHQSSVTRQIVSQGALWVVGDEEEDGSDKSVAPNWYRFNHLNLFLQEVNRLGGAEAEVQRKELSPSLYSKWYLLHCVIFLQFSSYLEIENGSILEIPT